MRLTLNAKVVGMGVGSLLGLLFVLLGWRSFLIFLGFAFFGFLVGFWLDMTPTALRRLREALVRLFS